MIKGIGHLGIFVADIESALAALSAIVAFDTPEIRESQELGLRCAVVELGGVALELLQGVDEDHPLSRLVKEKGDMIHHFCLLTDNIEDDVEALANRGVAMADPQPRTGVRGLKTAFMKPEAFNGITIELSEP